MALVEKDAASTRAIVVRMNFLAYGLAISWMLIGSYLVWAVFQAVSSRSPNATFSIGSLLAVCAILVGILALSGLFFWIGLVTIAQRYVVSLKGIEVRRLKGKRFFSWSEVASINTIPTFWFVDNLNLVLKDGKNVGLLLALSARYKQSCRAVLEAAHLANPDIELKFMLENDYGPPPYGIFKEARKTNA